MKGGTVHGGTVVRETAGRLTLRLPDGARVTVDKADIKSREPGVSGMPDGFGQILSKRDLRNLVEFLASLREGPATSMAVRRGQRGRLGDAPAR
jgi:quinoprotein glucose dehydrogenase